jgi:hypothetical protein
MDELTLEERCKLAYDLGCVRAQIDSLMLSKEASWASIGQKFMHGAKTMASGKVGGGQLMRSAVSKGMGQMAQPFKNLGQTYRANRFMGARRAAKEMGGKNMPNMADYGFKNIGQVGKAYRGGYTGALKGQGANLAAAGTVGATGLYAMS